MTTAGPGTPEKTSYRIADYLTDFVNQVLSISPKACSIDFLTEHNGHRIDLSSDKEDIIDILLKKLYPLFRKYAGNAYREKNWGELQFLKQLNGYDYESEPNDDFPFNDGLLRINPNSLINRIILLGLYWEYPSQLSRLLCVDSNQTCDKDSFLDLFKQKASESPTFLVRFLITAQCFVQRTLISCLSQHTFMGERFVSAKSAFGTKNDEVGAVPFNQVLSFSSIDSIRVLEKVNHYLNYHSPIEKIKIAAIGTFCDSPELGGKYHIEEYFDRYHASCSVSVVRFSLKEMNSCSLTFTNDDGECYNLFNIADWNRLCNEHKIVCLLDMGCFYTDTIRYYEVYNQTPFEALKDQLDYITYIKNRNGVNSVDLTYVEQLYHRYIQWIETNFYGKRHSFCFDSRLYSILFTDRLRKLNVAPDSEVFLYLSRDRDPNLYVQNVHKNLCKGEFYNAVEVQTYGLSTAETDVTDSYSNERKKELFQNAHNGSRIRVRMWKLIKSLGDNYYSVEFINILSDGEYYNRLFSSENTVKASADLEFVNYLQSVSLVFDYSRLGEKDHRISYNICYNGQSVRNSRYDKYIEAIVEGMIDLSFRQNTACSSAFTREIIVNSLLADSFSLEDLMLAHIVDTEPIGVRSLTLVRDNFHQYVEVSEEPCSYRQRQIENIAFFDAIAEINRTNRKDYYFAEDILQAATDKTKLNQVSGSDLLDRLGEICRSFGFINCALFNCAQDN